MHASLIYLSALSTEKLNIWVSVSVMVALESKELLMGGIGLFFSMSL